MSALPKMATATPYPPQRNSPYMKVDNYNDGDDGDDDDDDDGDDDDDDDDDIVTKYGYGMTKRVTIFIETIRSMIFGITWLSGPNTWRIYSS